MVGNSTPANSSLTEKEEEEDLGTSISKPTDDSLHLGSEVTVATAASYCGLQLCCRERLSSLTIQYGITAGLSSSSKYCKMQVRL